MRKLLMGTFGLLAVLVVGTIWSHCGGNGSNFECTTNTDCDETKNEYCDLASHTCKTQETCKTCDQLGKECGKWDDGCGKVINCGTCDEGTCNTKTGKCDTTCVPDCEDHKCGKDPVCGTKDCGTCTAPTPTCDLSSGQCKAACTPDCGTRKCGLDPVCNSKDCGTCTAPTPTCNASGQCESGPCVPDCGTRKCGKDPVCNTKDCGTCVAPTPQCNLETGQCAATCTEDCQDHVCDKDPVCGTKDCGACTAPTPVCNASGQCESEPCVPDCQGRVCGLDPVCNTKDCGTCTAPTPNCNASGQCEAGPCVPDCQGRVCGLDPVCNTKDCGACTDPATCNASGQCVCTPNCGARKCGKDPVCNTDCPPGCGNDICMPDGTCCVKPSDASFCSANGKSCGSYTGTNNCGVSQTANCGTCTNSLVCAWNNGAANVCDGPCNRALANKKLTTADEATATFGSDTLKVKLIEFDTWDPKSARFSFDFNNVVDDWMLLNEGEIGMSTNNVFEVTPVLMDKPGGTATVCIKHFD